MDTVALIITLFLSSAWGAEPDSLPRSASTAQAETDSGVVAIPLDTLAVSIRLQVEDTVRVGVASNGTGGSPFYLALLASIIGAAITGVAMLLAQRLQAKSQLRLQRDQATYLRRVDAINEAYDKFTLFRSKFYADTIENTLKEMLSNDDWFYKHRLFLPDEFVNIWEGVRKDLRRVVTLLKGGKPKDATAVENDAEKTIVRGIEILQQEMKTRLGN